MITAVSIDRVLGTYQYPHRALRCVLPLVQCPILSQSLEYDISLTWLLLLLLTPTPLSATGALRPGMICLNLGPADIYQVIKISQSQA
jgi:hypothetical protein